MNVAKLQPHFIVYSPGIFWFKRKDGILTKAIQGQPTKVLDF
jgi:hypothetical protein